MISNICNRCGNSKIVKNKCWRSIKSFMLRDFRVFWKQPSIKINISSKYTIKYQYISSVMYVIFAAGELYHILEPEDGQINEDLYSVPLRKKGPGTKVCSFCI